MISFSFQRIFHHLVFSLQWFRVIPKSPMSPHQGTVEARIHYSHIFYAHQTIQWPLMPCTDASPPVFIYGLPFICHPSECKYRTSQINLTSSWTWPQVQCSCLSKLLFLRIVDNNLCNIWTVMLECKQHRRETSQQFYSVVIIDILNLSWQPFDRFVFQ